MNENKTSLKEKISRVFESVSDRAPSLCVQFVWGDEPQMPSCLQKQCDDKIQ